MAMFGALNCCADIKKYEYLVKVGQGTFGEVHKARDRTNGNFVAIKKVLTDNCKEGMPITTIREVKILQQVVHENIVKLIEICYSLHSPNTKCTERNFYLVFEFCEHDLAGLLSNLEVKFSLEHIKMIMKQLLNALFFIHDKAIIHRDLKTSNVLVTKKGVLKLADFGLARVMKTRVANPTYTISVVTLWYRPPELLFKESNYTTSVDMWGAGCIMAELWTRRPILKGTCELHQLKLIIDLCGSINPDSYPGCEKIDSYNKWQLKQGERRKIKEKLQPYIEDPYALDLLDKLLCLDPASRIDSDTALNHDFFWCDPMPCELSGMLSKVNRSLFEYGIRKNGNGIAADAQRGRGQPRADDGQYHDRYFQELKEKLTSKECIVLADFAENYTFTIQDEIRSYHWNNNQQATIN